MNLLRQKLFGALVGLSRASESKEILESSGIALVQGLVMAYDSIWENDDPFISEEFKSSVEQMIQKLHIEKALMAPDCAACQYPCGRTADYDMAETLEASEPLREAKLYLFSLLGKIADSTQENGSREIWQFLSDALFQISCTYEAGQLTEPIQTAELFYKHP